MLHWPDATIYGGIADVADQKLNQPALFFEDDEITYQGLITESKALAHGLADLGIGEGDTVAIWLGNRPEWVITQLAASYLGAATVAVNTRYRTHELEYMLDDSGCRALIMEESFLGNDYLEMLSAVVPEIRTDNPMSFSPTTIPSLDHVITLKTVGEFPAVRSFDDVQAAGRSRDDITRATDAEAPACVFYTSGTTSDPKGCLQSSRSLLNHSYHVGGHLGVTEKDISLGVLPFCGIYGYNAFLSALVHGIPLVIQPYFDAKRAVELISEHEVTYVSALATMFLRMIETEEFTLERVSSIERGTVGFLSRGFSDEAFEKIEAAFDFPVVQPYGLSEANSQIFVGVREDSMEQRKKIGGPLIHPDIEVMIADPSTGEKMSPGEEGELCLRGYNVMNKYHQKPRKTAEAIDEDGWFHTGDLGVCDEQGYFYYQSRLDDALRVRGFLVTPRDIETVIDEHPEVERSQVVGISHPRHGQVPIAFVRRTTPTLDKTALRDYLNNHVADYKVPEDFEFVNSFPRSEGPHGRKIQKSQLRDRIADRYQDR